MASVDATSAPIFRKFLLVKLRLIIRFAFLIVATRHSVCLVWHKRALDSQTRQLCPFTYQFFLS